MKTVLVSGFLAVMVHAPAAAASETFPPELRSYYGVDTLPAPNEGCTLCHRTDEGSFKSITTPYGRALFGTFNVVALDVVKLRNGLQAAEAAYWDSDQDGIADADELRSGMNPNVFDGMGDPPPALKEIPLPRTGCSLGAGTPSGSGALASALFSALVLALRRVRQRKP